MCGGGFSDPNNYLRPYDPFASRERLRTFITQPSPSAVVPGPAKKKTVKKAKKKVAKKVVKKAAKK